MDRTSQWQSFTKRLESLQFLFALTLNNPQLTLEKIKQIYAFVFIQEFTQRQMNYMTPRINQTISLFLLNSCNEEFFYCNQDCNEESFLQWVNSLTDQTIHQNMGTLAQLIDQHKPSTL